jgi:hypothetical protein
MNIDEKIKYQTKSNMIKNNYTPGPSGVCLSYAKQVQYLEMS